MKVAFSFLLFVLFIFLLSSSPSTVDFEQSCLESQPLTTDEVKSRKPIPTDSIQILIHSMIYIESRGNDSSYCAKENAVGCLQIRPIMVKEVNRFLRKMNKTLRYTLNDRWSREKSIEMFRVWYNYRHSESTLEVIARSWNGGPRGPKRKSTLNYWKKVELHYDELDYNNYLGRYKV